MSRVCGGIGDLVNDGHNFYVSAEYRQQQQIRLVDRGYLFNRTDYTGAGGLDATWGVQNPLVGGLPRSGTGYVTDNDGNIVGFLPGCNTTSFAANQCTYRDM